MDHDDDVVALALHPSRNIVASGQVASLKRVTSGFPLIFLHVVFKVASLKRVTSGFFQSFFMFF